MVEENDSNIVREIIYNTGLLYSHSEVIYVIVAVINAVVSVGISTSGCC